MSFYSKHRAIINNIIEKVTFNTRHHCEQFAHELFADLSQDSYDEAIKIFYEGLTRLTHISRENFDQSLLQATSKLKNLSPNVDLKVVHGHVDESHQSQPLKMILVNHEREQAYDQEIDNEWKQARSNFFSKTIKQKFDEFQIQYKYQIQIAQMFLEARQLQRSQGLDVFLDQEEELYEYQQQIECLNQSFKYLDQHFSKRQKETPAITQIIRLKLTGLTVINIQYLLTIQQQYRYQINAFGLFIVIHENRDLSSVTIKGVLVKSLKYLIRVMMQSKIEEQQIKQEWRWMKDFKPSKQLKLTIDCQQFYLSNKDKDIWEMKDLAQFGGLFKQLGIIPLTIEYQESQQLTQVSKNLKELYKYLPLIDNIKKKIKIVGERRYRCEYPDQYFTVLLQMLASLTRITQLQFRKIRLSYQVEVNRLMAMEEIFQGIFKSNAITRLQLYHCQNFPILPIITTLQTIRLVDMSFRRQFGFMSELARNNPSLKSIQYSDMDDWRIGDQLFNQLQRLSIQQCRHISLDISSCQPSNIKYLTIIESNIGKVEDLSVLFPKLAHITQLKLTGINFGHQLLCTIPSPHLTALFMHINNEFKNQGLEAIDKKWPKLRQLTLKDCPQLNESGCGACEFKGLIRLQICTQILANGDQIRQLLRWRGIKVYQSN